MTNDPVDKDARPKSGATLKITFGALVALGASLAFFEGYEEKPYYDSVGVLTVCEGITGPKVIKNKTYSRVECDALRNDYVQKMSAKMSSCIGGTALTEYEWVAWGNFSYNVGEGAFCRSTAARMLREGKKYQACEQIKKWVFAKGRDCRIKANNCYGIVKRRAWENQTCHGEDVPVPKL